MLYNLLFSLLMFFSVWLNGIIYAHKLLAPHSFFLVKKIYIRRRICVYSRTKENIVDNFLFLGGQTAKSQKCAQRKNGQNWSTINLTKERELRFAYTMMNTESWLVENKWKYKKFDVPFPRTLNILFLFVYSV